MADIREEAASAEKRSMTASCRSCGHAGLQLILDLGRMPLTARFLSPQGNDEAPAYPLELAFCTECTLVQILETVPPEEMFSSDYPYYSSYSEAWLRHSADLARKLIARKGLTPKHRVIEIASNDGYLLKNFVAEGIPVLGIDPAEGTAREAGKVGVPTLCEFFAEGVGRRLADEGKQADVILGLNVLAHVAEIHSFLDGVRVLLKDDGLAVFEFPYLCDLVAGVQFDTIYHEHLCYYSLTSVRHLLAGHGLYVNDVEHLTSHGGSLRIFAEKKDAPGLSVKAMEAEEAKCGIDTPAYYDSLRRRTEQLRDDLVAMLQDLKRQGKSVAAYGAAAKGIILLNYAGVDAELVTWIADRNLHKQGLLIPGVRIPVCDPTRLLEERPDYLLILPWNLSEEIMHQERAYREMGGKCILPVPSPKIV